MDSRSYPQGSNTLKSKYVAGVLIFYRPSDGAELFRIDPSVQGGYLIPGVVKNIRTRFTTAQVNAGASFLPAIAGYKYRMIDMRAISIGGAASGLTTLDILGTQSSSSVKLAAFAVAALTQNTVLNAGDSGGAVLAGGVSFVANDSGTGITIGKTGSSLATATHVDVIATYVLEKA
jgi:hypothetical protein